jgi:hypothetical protein
MRVEPAPRLPVLPTATQSSAAEHEIPVRSTALLGGLWRDQVEPLLEVLTTYGVELRFVPTAIQVVSFVQVIADSREPGGIEAVVDQSLRSTVLRLVAPPPLARPTASQVDAAPHEMPVNKFTDGWSRLVHVDAFCVPMIDGRESMTPTATHVSEVGQETLARELSPDGGVCVQLAPPLLDLKIPDPPPA